MRGSGNSQKWFSEGLNPGLVSEMGRKFRLMLSIGPCESEASGEGKGRWIAGPSTGERVPEKPVLFANFHLCFGTWAVSY